MEFTCNFNVIIMCRKPNQFYSFVHIISQHHEEYLKREDHEGSNLAEGHSYNDISKSEKQTYGKRRSNSYPAPERDLPMLYITLLSSSTSVVSTSDSLDLNRQNESSNKRNKSNKDHEGSMFQCQELDGGNAIERKLMSIVY